MRLFVAIDLPQQVIANLERLIAHLRPTARIRWSVPANLHLTTKFIGEWPQERLEELKAALRGLTERQPIPIDVRELGFFPNARSPRVFWAGVQAPPALAELARDTDRALSRLGVPAENRPFSPHLTLALLIFFVVVARTRFISLGSMVGAVWFPLVVWLIAHPPWPVQSAAVLAAAFIVWRHKENIMRLRAGSEAVLHLSGPGPLVAKAAMRATVAVVDRAAQVVSFQRSAELGTKNQRCR